MAGSFLQTASRQVVDVSTFLKEAAGNNGIKYRAEKGKKHHVYFPYQMRQIEVDGQVQQVPSLVAIYGKVHEWNDSSNKYHATICLDGVVRKADDGVTILNDGSCPFCNRVADGWDIYKYRMDNEEATCVLTGENRKKHLETCKQAFANERKAKAANAYMYVLVALYTTNDSDGTPKLGDDQLPVYELKVMRLSTSRVEKIQKQLVNSGMQLAGSEVIFEYDDSDDVRLQISQSTISAVWGDQQYVRSYPGLLEKINSEVDKFQFDGIDEVFREWKGMSSIEAEKVVKELFDKWDAYQQEKLVNPNARYLEYASDLHVQTPNLTGIGAGIVPHIAATGQPTIPNIPGIGQPGNQFQQGMPIVPGIPGMGQAVNGGVQNNVPQQNANVSGGYAQQGMSGVPVGTGSTEKQVHQNTDGIPGLSGGTNNTAIPGMSGINTSGIPGMSSTGTPNVANTANELLGGAVNGSGIHI